MGIPFNYCSDRVDTGSLEIFTCQCGPAGIDFVGNQLAARGLQGQAEPDGRIALRRADLDHRFGIDRFCE